MKKIFKLFLFAFIGFSYEAFAITCHDMDSDHCNTYNATGGCRQWEVMSQCSVGMPTGTKRCGCKETIPGYYMTDSLDVRTCPIGAYCPGHVGAGGKIGCTEGKTTCQEKSQNVAQCVSPSSCSGGSTVSGQCVSWKEMFDECPATCKKCTTCKNGTADFYNCAECHIGTSYNSGNATCNPIECQSGRPVSTSANIENCQSHSVCWKNNATAYYCNQCKGDYILTGSGCSKPCEAGYFRPTVQASCQICPVNMYCPKGSTSPTSCNAVHYGYVTDGTGAKASTDCHEPTPVCQPGQYLVGSTCKPCPAGTYSSTEGATTCISCATGYWSEQGSSSCTKVNCAQFNPHHGKCVTCEHGKCNEIECDENYEPNYLTNTCESTSTVQNCMAPFVLDAEEKCCVIPSSNQE